MMILVISGNAYAIEEIMDCLRHLLLINAQERLTLARFNAKSQNVIFTTAMLLMLD
jgi:hypothetical protein